MSEEADALTWMGLNRTEVYKEMVAKREAPSLSRIAATQDYGSGKTSLDSNKTKQKPCDN